MCKDFSIEQHHLYFHCTGPPRDVTVTPAKEQYYPDDVITCSGNANPPVDYYIWEDITTDTDVEVIEEGSESNQLVMKEEWLGKGTMTIRCTVRNEMVNGQQTGSDKIIFRVFSKCTFWIDLMYDQWNFVIVHVRHIVCYDFCYLLFYKKDCDVI